MLGGGTEDPARFDLDALPLVSCSSSLEQPSVAPDEDLDHHFLRDEYHI